MRFSSEGNSRHFNESGFKSFHNERAGLTLPALQRSTCPAASSSSMAKPKQPGSVPNRPLYSRISYLYQAASYLSGVNENELQPAAESAGNVSAAKGKSLEHKTKQAMSRRLLTDMRATSLKTQIRLSPAMKRTICKYCDTLLIEGETCTSTVENKSRGGRKTWADVWVTTCKTCGGLKRSPVDAPRQKRRPARIRAAQGDVQEICPTTASDRPKRGPMDALEE
jgi:ribonuclease P protein subunit RPR2